VLFDLAGDGIGGFEASRKGHDIGARGRKTERHGAPDAGCSADDSGDFSFQTERLVHGYTAVLAASPTR
jgi:hypothetical protein